MKKYKTSFSFINLTQKSSEEVVKLQQLAKGLTIPIIGLTYFQQNADYALLAGFIGMVVDLLIGCISIQEVKE